MEILTPERYGEYEAYVSGHPAGGITQSVLWHGVKSNWGHEVVVTRSRDGAITGGVSVLIRRVPGLGISLMYSPRGPVCDCHDPAVLSDLKSGIDVLAKRYRAYSYKMDPDIPVDDAAFKSIAAGMGFTQTLGGDGFENIQARFNYRLYIGGKSEQEVMASFTQKTRYNIRVAVKHGVSVRVSGAEALEDFARLMKTTGDRDGFSVRPAGYFQRMLDELGEACRLYMAYYQGEAVSGAVATNYAGKTCYIYGASSNEHRSVMPNYLVQMEMIRWALETGCTVYDMQGVSGNMSEDNPLYGLYRFKKGFGGRLDELCGEFDYIYMPVRARLVDLAVDLNERLRAVKRGRAD